MVNKKIIDIIWSTPIYPVSWGFKNAMNYKHGITFNVIRNNSEKLMSVQDNGETFDIEVLDSSKKREYLISNVSAEDLIDEIDDYINGDVI